MAKAKTPLGLDRRHRWVYQITLGRYYVWNCRCCPRVEFTLSKRAIAAIARSFSRAVRRAMPNLVRSVYQPNPLYEVLMQRSA